MQHQLALLLGRLNPHETHGRAPHRLTDCLRVGGIVLIALDVSLHILRWRQTDLVAQLRQLARPMVRRGTGLHADQAQPAAWWVKEEGGRTTVFAAAIKVIATNADIMSSFMAFSVRFDT